MHIRTATRQDRDAVRAVHQLAFGDGERETVAELAVRLLVDETTPATFSLVAECDGGVVGHVAFSPVTIASDRCAQGYILAPLAVTPEYQGRGVGSQLIESGKKALAPVGVPFLFVYGDPAYYGRFGFRADRAEGFIPPYTLQYPFGWQVCVVKERETGEMSGTVTCVAALSDPKLW